MTRKLRMTATGKVDAQADIDFLSSMIGHHESAVQMVADVRSGLVDDRVQDLADDIVAAQSTEIGMMKGWLDGQQSAGDLQMNSSHPRTERRSRLSDEQGATRSAKRGREHRLFTVAAHQPEVREAGDGALTLEGYACVTEAAYEMRDWLGSYDEVVRRGAFAKTLADQDDVRLLLNHDGLPLARTKSGTLELDEDDTGLHTVARLDPGSGLVNDVRSAMARGDLDQMSFAFEVIRQQWSPDWQQRDILEVRLYDVAVVTYPANPATSASVRGYDDIDAMDDDAARAALGRLQARFAAASPEAQRQHPLSLYEAEAARLDFA